MVLTYTAIFVVALLLVAVFVHWHGQGMVRDPGSLPVSDRDISPLASGDSPPLASARENAPDKVQVATRSLRRLLQEAKEMKQMANRIAADANDTEKEIEVLIGGPK
jgi:hypothetical protein